MAQSALLTRLLTQGTKSVGAIVSRMDSWVNQLTGLGSTLRDKGMASEFQRDVPLTVEQCEALFHGDDMANRIVSAVPDDALREGIDIRPVGVEEEGLDLPEAELEDPEEGPEGQPEGYREPARMDADVAEESEDLPALQARVRELELVDRVREAMTWARCTGGAAVMLLVDGSGTADQPLVEERVTRVAGLAVVDRGDLTPATWYQDPSHPKYGDVETWYINLFNPQGVMVVSNVRVHETRLVMFRGAMTSRRERIRNGGWDHSVLQRSINILRQTNSAWDSVIHMMNDLSQAVFKINGLIDAIAEDDHTKIQKRMAVVDMVRSVARAIVLDSEDEDFKVVERGAVTGVDGLLDKTFLRLAATARMPVTILLGQAPAGLNATGAIDLRWWYDTVRTAQTHEIKPRAEKIIRLLCLELGLDPDGYEVCFPSLWQMTPTEEADLRAKIATADKAYVDMQAVLPEEVTLSRFVRGDYSKGLGQLRVDLESRRRMLAAELAKAEAAANKPDPEPPPPGQLPPGNQPPGQDPEDPEAKPTPPPQGE